MSEPITYAQAAELARRLDRERERGAVLLLDGEHVVRGFEHWPEAQQMDVVTAGNWCQSFYRPHWSMSPAEFEAHWQARITVLRPTGWPTGEAVTWEQADGELHVINEHMRRRHLEFSADNIPLPLVVVESAERLADVCRRLATESGE